MDDVEIQAACAALGYLDGDKYLKEPDCLETVKDLIRFLRRDNDSCDTRRQLGEAGIVSKDLLPILKQYHNDRVLFDTVVRLLANLTQPAKLCFQGHIPEDKTRRNYYLEIEGHLQTYKETFADDALFNVLASKLGDLLQLDWERRREEDRLLIERILIILRNILHVPPNTAKEMRTDDDASVHDQVLWALHISGMEDLLLYMAGSDGERQFALHVLEIISLMFREQTAEQLAAAGTGRAMSEKQRDESELSDLLTRERQQKSVNVLKYSSRHSNFGGTYIVANVKSISDRNVIYHHTLGTVKDMSFDRNKLNRKRPRNRLPITDNDTGRRSTLIIRLYLREFCTQFLENCYNPLMKVVKDLLARSKAQDSDETYYLWAMRFFMEFNRRASFNVALVSETMSVSTFHYVQINLQTYFDNVLHLKKEAVFWSRRMHLALKTFYELMNCVNAMDKLQDEAIRNSAEVIKNNVFYTMEYREIFYLLLKNFEETKQSRTFLRDAVEAAHLYIKMLEQYCKSHSHVVVQQKKRGKSKKKKKSVNKTEAPVSVEPLSEEERAIVWDEISDGLSSLLQGNGQLPNDILPFDAASPDDIEQQRIDAVYRIQDFLHQKMPGEALALMRASREVWPNRSEFGSEEMAPEDELLALRQLCLTVLPEHGRSRRREEEQVAEYEEEEDDAEMEEEEAGPSREVAEQEFSFNEFVYRFAQPQVVRACVILLSDFPRNTPYTNHCATKLLHRIGFEHGLIAMLYQARLFRIFNRLFSDSVYRSSKSYEELRQFGKHVLRKFFETIKTNSKVVMELFFWKSNKEAQQISEGYAMMQSEGKGKQTWTEEQDDELAALFIRYRQQDASSNGGQDIVDYIMSNMIDKTKTRRQVIRQMTHLDLIAGAKELKKLNAPARSRTWTEEQEVELRQLFEECRDADDILGELMSRLSHPRTKPKLVEKILELGLVEDKKELRKKRKSKSGGQARNKSRGGKDNDDFIDSDDNQSVLSDDGSSSEGEQAVGRIDSSGSGNSSSSSSSSSSDDDAAVSRRSPVNTKIKKIRNKKTRNVPTKEKTTSSSSLTSSNRRRPLGSISPSKISSAVARVRDNGLSSAVLWLSNCLVRTAEDRELDDDEIPVPMVPITEEQEDAMESKVFQDLLKMCGVNPPSNEQEQYWRIDGQLKPGDLRRLVSALSGSLASDQQTGANSDELSDDEKENRMSSKNAVEGENDDQSEKQTDDDALILAKQKREAALLALARRRQGAKQTDETIGVQSDQSPELQSKSRLKRFVAADDSDDSDDESRLIIASDEDCRPSSQHSVEEANSKKKARLADSDVSDSDEASRRGGKRSTAAADSDSEVSDVESPCVKSAVVRKRVKVASDSE